MPSAEGLLPFCAGEAGNPAASMFSAARLANEAERESAPGPGRKLTPTSSARSGEDALLCNQF